MKLSGPFKQIVTLNNLPLKGKLNDESLEIIFNGGILTENGKILEVNDFELLKQKFPNCEIDLIENEQTALPAFVDAHTHICFGGNRANDFAMRNAGKTYLEIAESGGGIWSSVQHTRKASEDELVDGILERINILLTQGITTIEIKSGYGLNVEEELKMLRAIKKAQTKTNATLIPTCLSAHLKPRDFEGSSEDYLNYILKEILPKVKEEKLSNRVDIFIEKSAFQPQESKAFLLKAKELGFQITVHADQFTAGSSRIAVEVGAKSADHLEATIDEDIEFLANSDTVAIALPGASLGLGDVAGYPEKHIEAPSMNYDLQMLKKKVEAGADYIVTQMFFDNQKFFDFVKQAREIGIDVPIIPGIKPIATKTHLQMLPQVFKIDLPEALINEVLKCKTNSDVREVGIEWAINQSKELLDFGIPVLHFYSMGKSDNILKIGREVF